MKIVRRRVARPSPLSCRDLSGEVRRERPSRSLYVAYLRFFALIGVLLSTIWLAGLASSVIGFSMPSSSFFRVLSRASCLCLGVAIVSPFFFMLQLYNKLYDVLCETQLAETRLSFLFSCLLMCLS